MTLQRITYHLSLGFIAAFLLFTGCNNKYIDEIDRGSGYTYKPGFPELRVAATGHIKEDNTPTIIVSGDVVYGSLVYTENNNGELEANILSEIIIQDKNNREKPLIRRNFEEKIRGKSNQIVNSQKVYRFEEVFEVEPGDYTIRVIITDQTSKKQMMHTLETSLPDPEDETSHITEIRVLGKNSESGEGFSQATTYDIPLSSDSLKFVFQVTNNKADEPMEITSRLLKFRSDTSIARPMHFNDYSPSSLSYIGIDYDKYEVIQTSTRLLTQPGSVVIEFAFENLPRGNYRLEVSSNADTENELYKARDFGIKSPNYPSLKTPFELARPLYYIMYNDEYEELMAIKNPQKLKEAIDRFWLSNVQNSKVAKNVISEYYQRVEEANKQFSNFKEGWKTDLGMVYILFGPPLYSDNFSGQILWSYSYDQQDPERNFVFNRTKLKSKFFPFHNYILNRDPFYNSVQYQQIERWRNGSILSYNL